MNKNQWPLSIGLRKDLHEVVVNTEAILRIVNRIAVVEPQNR